MEEEKLKFKSELKMFIYYLLTEPWRKVRYLFRVVHKEINVSSLLYVLATMTVFMLYDDLKSVPGWLGLVTVVVVGLNLIWRRKRFIHVYRKTHYRGENNKAAR